eukprot:CAMPEP_0179310898 /NCGR_PEP_ID=MMETSP0797-20121207/52407_1 /TAXON_ID=47934 /ORGANISM="Dinophysis acuminata, Strain DAEP01" /LENGTH=52 /DNA_ID=CAMNT_0021020653 /DNA_START=13 /DNA_END=167 /DNA_ORIENTATION=-
MTQGNGLSGLSPALRPGRGAGLSEPGLVLMNAGAGLDIPDMRRRRLMNALLG